MGILITFNYRIVDGKGKKGLFKVYSTTDIMENGFVDCEIQANALMPIIRNAIRGGIIGCRVSMQVYFGDLYLSFPSLRIPDPDSDVEEGAILYFDCDEGGKWQPRISTFDESLLLSGTRIIDESNAQYLAFVSGVSDAPTLIFTNSRGNAIMNNVLGGNEKFRKRKRRKPTRR